MEAAKAGGVPARDNPSNQSGAQQTNIEEPKADGSSRNPLHQPAGQHGAQAANNRESKQHHFAWDHSPGAEARNVNDSDSDNLSFNGEEYQSMEGRQMNRCNSAETNIGFSLDAQPKKTGPDPETVQLVEATVRSAQGLLHNARSPEDYAYVIGEIT